MTNQEAIKIIEDECEHIKSHLKCKGKAEDFYKELGDMCIAFDMAIKALEQEPSGDLISRQAVLDWFCKRECGRQFCDCRCDSGECDDHKALLKLPPVNPQEPKTGHWIDMDEGFSPCKCSECESVDFIKSKYCPNCGCRMESEDKE